MASNLFDEDVVRRTHRGAVQFGLVLRNYEGYSSLEDSDDEEDTIKKGHVRVAWYPKGREEVVPENKVALYDRSVMPGDAVRRMTSSCGDTQRGIVRSVNVSCHVQSIRSKQMIYEVPSRDLTQLLVFQPGGHCVLGSWIGVVRNVFVRVIVRLKNGSRCALSDEGASRLTDVHDNSEEDSVFSYQDGFYPGQVLRGPACAFKNASWLSGTQPILSSRAYFKVTVEEVNVVGLDVHWQTRGLCKGMSDMDGKIKDEDMQPPARKVPEGTLPQVKPLNYFVAASIQIGDKAMYTVKSDDLKYPQPVARGSAPCFTRPAAVTQTVLQNTINFSDDVKITAEDHTSTETKSSAEAKDVILQIPDSRFNLRFNIELVPTQNKTQMEETGAETESGGDSTEKQAGTSLRTETNEVPSVDGVKSQSDCNICKGTSVDAKGQPEENSCIAGPQHSGVTDKEVAAPGAKSMCEQNSTGANIDQVNTGISEQVAKGLSKSGGSHGKAQEILPSDVCVSSTEDSKDSKSAADGIEAEESQSVGVNSSSISSTKNEDEKEQGKNGDKSVKQHNELEVVQGEKEALHKADEIKTDLARDVDLLSALHSDLCEASESIVKIADSFKPLLQRASNESAKEISGHVTRLLESRERLNEQINLTEGLLKGGKKTIGVLQHLADNRMSKSKNQGKEEDANLSSDEYTSDDDDAGSQAGSIGSVGSNASGKGSRSRPKVVSSRLLRHNRNQQPRMLTRKRPPPKPVEGGERICTEVTHTWTLVDVMWQDGNQEQNIVSAELFPAHQLDELEFFPGDFVTKNNEDIENVYGLVCKADHKERTCLVQWIRRPKQNNPLPEKINREEVSVYELTPHPDFTFNVGDVVVRIATSQAGTPQTPEEQSCAGQVRWVNTDGTIHVAWVDSTESSVLPQDLYKLEEDSDSDWSDYGNDDEEWEELNGKKEKTGRGSKSGSESDSSWETASASISTSSLMSGDGEQDAKSEGTKSTSISIEEAAKEEEEKIKKDKSSPSSPSSSEKQKEDKASSKVEETVQEATKDAMEEEKGATASVAVAAASTEGIDKGTHCPSPPVAANDKPQTGKELDKAVAEETLAQLSDIEDKMNQLCSAANSLLKRKRFLAKGEEKVKEEEEDLDADGGTDSKDVAKVVDDTEEGEKKDKDSVVPDEGTDVSGRPDDDSVDAKGDLQSRTEMVTAIVCDNNMPPVEDAVSKDSVVNAQGDGGLDNSVKTTNVKTAVTEDVFDKTGNFILMEEVPNSHAYAFKSANFTPDDPKSFATCIRKEMKLLQTSLPQGIIVKAFSDRMDLFSVLFEGPENTPYEDGLFYFDVRLPPDYPRSPPIMHFHAFCSGRLNPNLYNDGKVCVSLLGTWTGKGNEMWTSKSNLLQVLVSIQGLILVSEPYYNEAGYDKHRGSQQGLENSRMYNETAVLKLIQSMQMMVSTPPELFRDETLEFCRKHAYRMIHRVDRWLSTPNQLSLSFASASSLPQSSSSPSSSSAMSTTSSSPSSWDVSPPPAAASSSKTPSPSGCVKSGTEQIDHAEAAFPLFPLSRGFLLSAKQALRAYRKSLHVVGIEES